MLPLQQQIRPPLSVNVVVCESVLTEKNDLHSAIRIFNTIKVSPNNIIRFYTLTCVTSYPGDLAHHIMKVQMARSDGGVIAAAPEQSFTYGYRLDPDNFGGFNLTTEFSVDLSGEQSLGGYIIQVLVDGVERTQAPFILHR